MHHLNDPDVRNKIYKTNLQRYGFTNPGSSSIVESKRIQTNLQRYGASNPMENSEIRKKSLRNRFHVSRAIFPESTKKKSIESWNRRYRDRDEINDGEISYIRNSTIYPWENFRKAERMLLPRKGIYVEDCKMIMVYRKIAAKFLSQYDIYGSDSRNELCIGLIYQDELVQVMTIGKAKDLDHTYQIYRLCTKPGLYILGGSMKMFEHVTRDFEVNNIIAYHGTSKENNTDEFQLMGMNQIDTITSQKIWYHHNLMIPDDQLFERDLKKMFEEHLPKQKLMQLHDWRWIETAPIQIFSYKNN